MTTGTSKTKARRLPQIISYRKGKLSFLEVDMSGYSEQERSEVLQLVRSNIKTPEVDKADFTPDLHLHMQLRSGRKKSLKSTEVSAMRRKIHARIKARLSAHPAARIPAPRTEHVRRQIRPIMAMSRA